MATSTNSSPTTTNVPRVDTHLAKFSQASIVVLTALAFILNQPIIVAITAVVMALSALAPSISPFRLIYNGVLIPLHLLKPRIVEDDPAPHEGYSSRLGARSDRFCTGGYQPDRGFLRGLLRLLSPGTTGPAAPRALRRELPLARRLNVGEGIW